MNFAKNTFEAYSIKYGRKYAYMDCLAVDTWSGLFSVTQDIGWFDKHTIHGVVTHLADDMNTIQDGIGSKLALTLQYFSSFVTGMLLSSTDTYMLLK